MIKTHEQEVRKAVEDFLHDEFNLEDRSVGIDPVGSIDEQLVEWINNEVEGFTVKEWSEDSMVIECEGVLVKIAYSEDEEKWVIVD